MSNSGSDSDNYESSTSDLDNAGVKAVITLGIIIIAIGFSFLIAKVCKLCRKNIVPEDDDSDVSENTRHVLNARLSVLKYKRREMSREKRAKALSFINRWISHVQNMKRRRGEKKVIGNGIKLGDSANLEIKVAIENADAGKGIEDIVVKDGDTILTPRMARLPVFAKSTGDHVKTHELPKPVHGQRVSQSSSPVPRGRPVSSKSRVLTNVTLTTVDVNNKPKVVAKTVHFKDIGSTKKSDNTNVENKNNSVSNTVTEAKPTSQKLNTNINNVKANSSIQNGLVLNSNISPSNMIS
ncbi:hypothetical protein MAR_025736 [Mya arenaria]|uniref:Uncharacterized protein n=1 Tax=Mya arenaria TaxID=6604 RepID=A0ABY7ES52_MYAAR|nr:uncharacterized protein LOC128243859 [Mya arenaria]WAR11556.1 hypothetical protein MAR_025736 [Mya arenaria]